LNFLDRFSKNTQISNFNKKKSIQLQPGCSMQTDMMQLTVIFHNFVNAPTNVSGKICKENQLMFYVQYICFQKSRHLWGKWKNMVQPDMPQMIIQGYYKRNTHFPTLCSNKLSISFIVTLYNTMHKRSQITNAWTRACARTHTHTHSHI
jgi:hypothetical protein